MRGNENKKLRLNNIGTRSYFDASFQNLANFQVLIRNTAVIASLLVIAPPMLFATEGFRFEFLGLLKSWNDYFDNCFYLFYGIPLFSLGVFVLFSNIFTLIPFALSFFFITWPSLVAIFKNFTGIKTLIHSSHFFQIKREFSSTELYSFAKNKLRMLLEGREAFMKFIEENELSKYIESQNTYEKIEGSINLLIEHSQIKFRAFQAIKPGSLQLYPWIENVEKSGFSNALDKFCYILIEYPSACKAFGTIALFYFGWAKITLFIDQFSSYVRKIKIINSIYCFHTDFKKNRKAIVIGKLEIDNFKAVNVLVALELNDVFIYLKKTKNVPKVIPLGLEDLNSYNAKIKPVLQDSNVKVNKNYSFLSRFL